MKNIYLRISGGLGNQLYQFSFAYYLYSKLAFDKIIIDTSGMKNYNEYWGFLLYDVLSKNELDSFVSFGTHPFLKLRVPKLIQKFGLNLSYCHCFISDGSRFGNDWEFESLSSCKNLFLDGYFEKVDVREQYKFLLQPFIRKDLQASLPKNLVVVNVRGGEFVRLGLSSEDDINYYRDAIFKIKKEVDNPVFHLITDDVIYAKSLLKGICDFEHIHSPHPQENFKFIMNSKVKVLSMSTFAKWAAVLGDDALVYWKSVF